MYYIEYIKHLITALMTTYNVVYCSLFQRIQVKLTTCPNESGRKLGDILFHQELQSFIHNQMYCRLITSASSSSEWNLIVQRLFCHNRPYSSELDRRIIRVSTQFPLTHKRILYLSICTFIYVFLRRIMFPLYLIDWC